MEPAKYSFPNSRYAAGLGASGRKYKKIGLHKAKPRPDCARAVAVL